jgi:hypothetical protein
MLSIVTIDELNKYSCKYTILIRNTTNAMKPLHLFDWNMSKYTAHYVCLTQEQMSPKTKHAHARAERERMEKLLMKPPSSADKTLLYI